MSIIQFQLAHLCNVLYLLSKYIEYKENKYSTINSENIQVPDQTPVWEVCVCRTDMQANTHLLRVALSTSVWIHEKIQSSSSALTEACCSSLGWGFPVVREARRNERVWSHLNSAGRLQLSGADLRGHKNIPGLFFTLRCVSTPPCICSFDVSRCQRAEGVNRISGGLWRLGGVTRQQTTAHPQAWPITQCLSSELPQCSPTKSKVSTTETKVNFESCLRTFSARFSHI